MSIRTLRLAVVSVAAATTVAVSGVAPAQAAAPVSPAAPVTTTVVNADGSVTETIYTPAPGVKSADLANSLAQNGVSVKTETGFTVQAAACSLGVARTWPSSGSCFVRWAYRGAVRPIINFVDHSSAAWPVGRAVTEWNKTSGIDSIYRPASRGCDGAPVHCVHVYSGNYGNTGWVGLTSRTMNSAQTYYTGASVKMNDYYGGTEAQRWSDSCHELGHVLGLGHGTSTSSCMWTSRTSYRYPHADDRKLLERYY